MYRWVKLARITFFLFVLTSCAVRGKGILLSVEPATPLDQRDLHMHCDLGDQAACALSEHESNQLQPRFSIVQGIAPPDRAVFVAAVPKEIESYWYIYDRDAGRLWKLHDSRRHQRKSSHWYIQRIEARDLLPGRTYELLAGDKQGNLVEDRKFSTLKHDSKRLQLMSIHGLKSQNGQSLKQAISDLKPALLLFSGDNVKIDLPTGKNSPKKRADAMDWYFSRHLEARNSLSIAKLPVLTPSVGMIGETEFGIDTPDRTFRFRDEAREIFEIFFPVWADELNIVNGPGVSLSFPFAGNRIAILDPYSFRHPDISLPSCSTVKIRRKKGRRKGKKNEQCSEETSFNPRKSRFGEMQINWLFGETSNGGIPTWIISSEGWLETSRASNTKKTIAPTLWFSQLEEIASKANAPWPSLLSVIEKNPEKSESDPSITALDLKNSD